MASEPSTASADMNYQQSLDYLYSFVNFERTSSFEYNTRTLDLDAFRDLLGRLGDPDRSFKIVHVSGTKGKGSICYMIASVLRSSGIRTGLFTSPHLLDVRERVQVDGKWIDEETFASVLSDIEPIHSHQSFARQSYRTTFELLTALALVHFAREHVEIAVLETGLGGRLDSTNVTDPMLCVISRIGYDHTNVLGGTLSEIAYEKAGIIKESVPVVVGPQEPEALRVILDTASSRESRIVNVGSEYTCRASTTINNSQMVAIEGMGQLIDGAKLPLLGAHQLGNAACAVAAAQLLSETFPQITSQTIRRGLSEVRLMGRIEVLRRDPAVVVDCAHNRESAAALLSTLRSLFTSVRRTAVVGLSRNKEAELLLAILASYFDRFMVTKANTERAMEPSAIADILAPLGVEFELFQNSADAASKAMAELRPEDLLCVTGSVYLAGELRPVLAERIGEAG